MQSLQLDIVYSSSKLLFKIICNSFCSHISLYYHWDCKTFQLISYEELNFFHFCHYMKLLLIFFQRQNFQIFITFSFAKFQFIILLHRFFVLFHHSLVCDFWICLRDFFIGYLTMQNGYSSNFSYPSMSEPKSVLLNPDYWWIIAVYLLE